MKDFERRLGNPQLGAVYNNLAQEIFIPQVYQTLFKVKFIEEVRKAFANEQSDAFLNQLGRAFNLPYSLVQQEQFSQMVYHFLEGFFGRNFERTSFGSNYRNWQSLLSKAPPTRGANHVLLGCMTPQSAAEFSRLAQTYSPEGVHHILDLDTSLVERIFRSSYPSQLQGVNFVPADVTVSRPIPGLQADVAYGSFLATYMSDRSGEFDDAAKSILAFLRNNMPVGGRALFVERLYDKNDQPTMNLFKQILTGMQFEVQRTEPGEFLESRRGIDMEALQGLGKKIGRAHV